MAPDMGVMVSASWHNPMPDNGIKFFAIGGRKLEDGIEDEIEQEMGKLRRKAPPARPSAGSSTSPTAHWTATCTTCSRRCTPRLDGIKVVVDCAHGAAYQAAPLARGRGRRGGCRVE